ncbi:NDP-hexose 2,3-dehydratase family protein (plasmid) [Streptomyces sp. BI20]|uniref:NDP-hexose 2,3-dehydratase family protein n=1 Tax=Streptomyces sp. BI20 TaxID=3403460 RepID=UPI003C7102AB
MPSRLAAPLAGPSGTRRRSLRPRADPALAARLARSAATRAGAHLDTREVHAWLAHRRAAHAFRVDRVPLADLRQWHTDPATGNLLHHSGRFFTVEGLHVVEHDGPLGDGPRRDWQQPVIRQPEVGILGILAREIDGVLHFLMQAKMEPGNPGLLQLSPTVQATRSNWTRAHRGSRVQLVDQFVDPHPDRVLVDVLQSEQGSWFHHKSNRNMIVETDTAPPFDEDFRWLTLGQLADLLHEDETVNMNARTVLSCVPYADTTPLALHSDTALRSWFTGLRAHRDVRAERVPLASVRGWRRGPDAIEHEDHRYFRVIAVSVRAGSREVRTWDQPLVEPVGLGVTAFLTRRIDGVEHVLVQARAEGGFLDTVELAPTVQCDPVNHAHLPAADRPPFLDTVLDAPPARIRYQAVHSEEGGRFHHARSRYLVVDAAGTPAAALDPPPGYAWATPAQLRALTRHGHYLNVEARTLLACLNAMAARTLPGEPT